jgi:sterol desaturase/sphingolipid hydroxylase (fatty acid hydroxylase superfamily)
MKVLEKSGVAHLIRWASFPLIFTGGLVASYIAFRLGANSTLIIGTVLTVYLLLLTTLERLIPYHRRRSSGTAELVTDVVHFIAMLSLGSLTASVVGRFAPAIRVIPESASLFADLPFLLQLFIALAVGDFFPYWLHRISHERDGFLRRVHAVHHSIGRLYFFNAARFHPVNLILNVLFRSIPIGMIGGSAELVFVVTMTGLLHNFASHANVDFRLGVLNLVFSMTELHRIHHSNRIEESDGNYGGTLILWDLIFGTRLSPRNIPDDRIGLPESGLLKENYLVQTIFPLCTPNRDSGCRA